MTLITPLAQTPDTVTLRRVDWDALLDQLEDLQDTAAVAARRAYVERVGKDIAEAGYLTGAELRRLLDCESPVKVWREKRGLSQRELADRANISASYLAEIETGRKPGSSEALLHLSRALGVRMEDLAERDRVGMSFAYLNDIIDAGGSPAQADAAARDMLRECSDAMGPQARAELRERMQRLAADYASMRLTEQASAAMAVASALGSAQLVG
jgi:transcriptional regulator with XRE-family HTH domain